MERDPNKRLKLGMNPEEHNMLRALARDNGLDMSAYVRALIRREWNASPHLWEKMRGEEESHD